MALNFNPFSWFSKISKTGVYLDNDFIANPTDNVGASPISNTYSNGNKSSQGEEEKQALINKFIATVNTRSMLLNSLRDLRKRPIVQTIIDAYINEGFYSNNRFEVFSCTYMPKPKKKEIQKIIDDFIEKFKLQHVIVNLLPNLLVLGEYFLAPILDPNKKDGVIDILDNVITDEILPVYRGQLVKNFFKKTNSASNPVRELPANNLIHFVLPGEPVVVRIEKITGDVNELYQLPEYLKVGKSIFFDAIDLIKRLETLDLANLALTLRQILLPILLSIGVPAGTPIKDVIALTEHYENHIEQIFSDVGSINNLTVTNLLQLSSKIRALPQYSDGKGTLEVLDLLSNKQPNTEQTNNIKKEIGLLTSTPFYFIATDGTEAVDRTTMLKNYSKFTKRLTEVQFAVRTAIIDLICLHLNYSGYVVKPSELDVNFKQIINVDVMDRNEQLIGAANGLSETYDAFAKIASDPNSKSELDPDVLDKIIDEFFYNIPTAKGILKRIKPKPEEKSPSEDNTDLNQFDNTASTEETPPEENTPEETPPEETDNTASETPPEDNLPDIDANNPDNIISK